MNIKDSLTQFSFNRLSDVEYVRLCRMGYFDHELEAVSKFFYDDVMREYNKRNAVYANIKGRVNIWKAPLQPKQVAFLEFFGFEGSEEDKATVTDAEARRMIAVIQFAIGNQRFIAAYPAWLKDSTESGFRDFTDADIAQMQKTLLKL